MSFALLGLLLLATEPESVQTEAEPEPPPPVWEIYVVASSAYDAPFDYVIQIRIGSRFELPLAGPWKPYLWTAFAHNHESPVKMVLSDPLGHIFGLSNHGVNHRSGLELGLGMAYEFPRFSPWRI